MTFTAVVAPTNPAVGATPTGNVQFKIDGANPTGGLVAVDVNGIATFTTSAMTVGAHTVTAVYAGDVNFIGSTSAALSQTVKTRLATTTAVTSSVNPSVWRQSVTFTATVTPENLSLGTATGTVQWRIDGANVTTSTLVAGKATYTTATLARGTHTVVASYLVSTSLAASTSPTLTQTVNRAATMTVVTLQSPIGSTATKTYTATVSAVAPGGGIPNGGTVQFRIDGVNRGGARPVANGVATWTTTLVLSVGNHTVIAIYSPGTSYLGSTSAPVTQRVQ